MKGIVLYGPSFAPYTEKVRRALLLKGLEFEFREPAGPEDYARWSPKTGLLPVLQLDGEKIPDSTDILFRLDELYPDPPLLSPDARIAGQQRQLEDWADENLSWFFNKWRRSQPDEAASEAPTGLRFLWAWLRAGTWERPEISIVRDLAARLDDLVGFLGARSFFYSERLSMADLSVYSMLITIQRNFIPGSAGLLAGRPGLVDFMHRVEDETEG